MAKDLVWFKKNVGYNIAVRRYTGDKDGVFLSGNNPYVSVERDDLRDFKMANRKLLTEGQLIETEEPSVEWDVVNAISDEEIVELTSNHLKLKSRLPQVTSVPILYKLLEEAKQKERAKRVINMIQARIDDLEEETDFANTILGRDSR
jgi:hypothetical protein